MLSGMTAFVTTKSEDVKFTRVSVGKALKAGGLKLERVKQREIASTRGSLRDRRYWWHMSANQ